MAHSGTNYYTPKPEMVGDELLKRIASIHKRYGQYDDYQTAAAVGLPLEEFVGRKAVAESQHRDKMKTWGLGTPLSVTGDCLIVGDVHVPFTDWTYTALVSKIAEKHLSSPRQLIIAGDLFNLDLFSDYCKLVSGPDWRDEKRAAVALAQEWGQVFDTIYFMAGNHDRRISRRTDGEMDVRDLCDFLSLPATQLIPSLLGYCNLESGGIPWRVTHAREYSVNKLTVAGELALKFQSNICSFHEHHLAKGWDRFYRYCIVNGGSLVRQSDLAYASLDDSKRPNFNTGFVMIKSGCPYLFGRAPFTNWEEWL